MKKLLTILLAVGIMASFVACGDNENPTQSGEEQKQSGEQNMQAEGTVISIEGNASTGYTWHAVGYDPSIIKVEEMGSETLNESTTDEEAAVGGSGDQSGENASGENLVGVPSIFKFKITGLEAGSTNLTFKYYRSWEPSTTAIDEKSYVVTVDNLLNVVATEEVEVDTDIPTEDDYTASAEMENLVNDLITASEVQFAMPATSKILLANAPTFVGISEDLFTKYVVDSVVYEPMISPATSSMCIVKLSEDADIATMKQTVLDNCNPAKWICTGAEKCLVIESGRYIMLVMSTPDNCEALKDAFVEKFGAEKVGEPLTKDGVSSEMEDFPEVL